jgi:hypothetical protein
MFGRKTRLLKEAQATITSQEEMLDWYQRHYVKQQGYIEGLYDVIGDLSVQLSLALGEERLKQNSSNNARTSDFFSDLAILFSTKLKTKRNVKCYFGKPLPELKKRFHDRDFRNSSNIYLTERFSLDDLRRVFRELAANKPLEAVLTAIRESKKLDAH